MPLEPVLLDGLLPQAVAQDLDALIPVVVDVVVRHLNFQTGLRQMMRRILSRVTVVVAVVCGHKTSLIDSLGAPAVLLVAMVVALRVYQPLGC